MKNYPTLIKRLSLLAILTIAPALLAATSYTRVTEIGPPDPVSGQWFGLATAISDDIAVVGAPLNFAWFVRPPPIDGAAYVYARTDAGWVFQQKLVASDGNGPSTGLGNQFGYAVAVAGDTIVVGAPSRRIGDGKSGAVYVFKRSDTGSNWTEQAIITSSTSRPFGLSLALRGGTLVVGGLEDSASAGGTDSGLAFVFKRSGDNWVEEGNLMSGEVQAHNRYGVSVDVRGNTVVVGAEDISLSQPSAVYVFSRQEGAWTQETKLSPANDSVAFGHSVRLWGASLAVGDSASSTVSIYEHIGQNWELVQTLTGTPGTEFGSALAQKEDRLLVGAQRATVEGVNSGAAYLYRLDEETGAWALNQTLAPADGQALDLYGAAVGLSGTAAIVGAPRHLHSPNPQSGAAYINEP